MCEIEEPPKFSVKIVSKDKMYAVIISKSNFPCIMKKRKQVPC